IFFRPDNSASPPCLQHRQRFAVAVSVGAHYRVLNLLCKREFLIIFLIVDFASKHPQMANHQNT
ncbi:hypothetical protein, partial [Shewanella fodinae]|uniref:hypothetical protein n=1 Tax=Shewanella fodinae TaxID=552357 RepID=UPI001A9DD48F